ncbi:MAG: type IV pilus assembly protein PilM, partial [Planctomycetes bacterium]|nr:type IV pilus assembly protein PilM [Planctomycetota bacterium]
MAKSAWGIEAGTSSIKAIKLTHDGKGGVTLDDVSSHDLAHYYVDGGDERSALVRGLAALVAEKGLKPGDDIFVSLPSRNQISRVIALPPVGEDAIRETIVHEARGQIPIKLEDAVWDYHLVDNAEPGELLVNLYAVKRDVIDALLNLCNLAGLPVTGIQLAPLGIYNYVKHELDLEISESCVCIDIGADNTDLVIIDGQKTWLRTVPFAGNDITKALMMRFKKLTPAQAEKLKRKAAESKDAPKIFEAMKPPLKEMVGEVHRCVGFYKNQNENAQLNKLVMMGNGSKLFNIAKFFEQQLQYEVHRVEELTNIQLSRGVDPAKVQENVPSLVVAIGLALQAVGVPGMISTNLVPPELVKEEALKKVRPLALVAGGMVFVAGLAMFLMSLGPKGDAEEFTRTLGEDAGKIEQRRTELANQKARDEALNAEATTLNNTDRADDLPYLGYLFLRDTVREFSETKNPEAKFLWCMKRENRG